MKAISQSLFPKRAPDIHKYAAGTVAVVGGSARYPHAPVIAALGARAAGAGLVQLVAPDESRAAAGCHVPEATFTSLAPACKFPKADVVAVGMGLGAERAAEELLHRLLQSAGRVVIDADALAVLAGWRARGAALPAVDGRAFVLTPHEGEAARLLDCRPDEVHADRPSALRRIVERYGSVVVLKGRHTLVGAPGRDDVFECGAGNPFMAMGGMGDLLSGIVAARWARLVRCGADDPFGAASAAVWLHAAASDSIVMADPPGDPSIANTARAVSSIRTMQER